MKTLNDADFDNFRSKVESTPFMLIKIGLTTIQLFNEKRATKDGHQVRYMLDAYHGGESYRFWQRTGGGGYVKATHAVEDCFRTLAKLWGGTYKENSINPEAHYIGGNLYGLPYVDFKNLIEKDG